MNNKIIAVVVGVLILIVGIGSYILGTSNSGKNNKDTEIVQVIPKVLISEAEASELAINQVFNSREFTTTKECMFAEPYTRFNNATDFEVRIVKSETCDKVSSMLLQTVRVNLETKEVTTLAYVNDEQVVKVQNYALATLLNQNFCDRMTKFPYATLLTYSTDFQTATTSGACQVSVGPNTSLNFSFDNISASTTPRFVLNIFDPVTNQVQSIRLAYDWEYNNSIINLNDDINFDGYKDMLMRTFGRRASQFNYYLYDPVSKTFKMDEMLSSIYTPTFNPQERTITTTPDIASYYIDNNGEQKYSTPEDETSVYKFVQGKYVPSN